MTVISQAYLLEHFSALPDWQSRYRQLILFGHQLPPFPEDKKSDIYLVAGCENKVWLCHQADANHHHFLFESDAKIMRGLLALLLFQIQDQETCFIAQFDLKKYLQALRLGQHLSDSRSQGLQKIWLTIQRKVGCIAEPGYS